MRRPHVVIIDDSPVNIQILMQILLGDYSITPFSSVTESIEYFKRNPAVDLILLDIDMPKQNGYDVFAVIKNISGLSNVPIIFITGRTDVESEISAFDLGIVDYIKKPIIPMIAKKRIEFQISCHFKEQSMINEANIIKKLTEVTIKTLISLVDKFNDESERHISRIMEYVTALSEKMIEKGIYKDELNPVFVEKLRLSSPFHDCGKVYVSDDILIKSGKLTSQEFAEVQKHTVLGSNVMKKARFMMGEPSFYDIAEKLVLNYHEKWDGTGYPSRIKGEEIPLCARIMAFADVYDALVSQRPYKEPYTHEKAVEIIMAEKGAAFDPVICDVFYEISDDFKNIAENLKG